jgi:hypothetical protein
MNWIENFTIGRAGSEMTFANNPAELEWGPSEIAFEDRNLAGQKKKLVKRITDKVRLTIPIVEEDELNKLISMANDNMVFKRFLVSTGFAIIDERRYATGTAEVELMPSSRAGITIQGVWLATDTAHEGTNFYTGGSFNETTRVVTLGTPLEVSGSAVLVSYLYQGWNVDITDLQVKHNENRPHTAEVMIDMEGI